MFEVIELGGVKTVTTKAACNHVYVVDVSYSMYNALEKLRQHLKNIISVVAQPDDTFSVIYFSSKGQCGVVFENVLVSDLKTVSMMHTAIDRYIQCIGATGFIDPLKKALTLKLDPTKVNNFIMLTDGYDNQSNRGDIVLEAAKLKEMYQSITFIEYGFYADRDLLTKMAEEVNGNLIFAEGIVSYEAVMEDVVRGVARVANIDVAVNKKAKHGVYVYNGQIKIVAAVDGVVQVPEDTDRVYSIVPNDVLNKKLSDDHLYMILYYAAKSGFTELVWKCLQSLGDVDLVERYQNAFTKQELSAFEDAASKAVLDVSARYTQGKDLSAVPDKNTPTVIDLLNTLAGAESFVVTDSPYWSYNRTGRASTTEAALPRFVQSPMSKVSLKGLVFNSERPNVSIGTTLSGVVELPENEFKLTRVPSFITRNYTVIKDGIRNMDKLPVIFPAETGLADLDKFSHEVIEEASGQCYWVFDLTKTPVINRAMVESVNLEDFKQAVQLVESSKASLKVLTHFIKASGGTNSKITGLIDTYGEGAAKWLSEIGVRDYGFSPVGTTSVEATDEYESIQVVYKIKGMSSMPAVDAVQKKIDAKKALNIGDTLIKAAVDTYKGVTFEELEADKASYTAVKRKLESQLANIVYTLVLGRQWYGDDEVVSTDITLGGQTVPMTIEKVRKFIKI